MSDTDSPTTLEQSAAETRKILNRLRRAQGQLTAVIAAVENRRGGER